jgi:hypothetical protein
MDQRLKPRYPATFDAVVAPLDDPANASAGRVVDISEGGVRVLLPVVLQPGTVVRMNIEESVLFGHVIYATPQEDQSQTGIEVERVLLGEGDVSQLLQAVLMETMPELPGVQPSSAYHG